MIEVQNLLFSKGGIPIFEFADDGNGEGFQKDNSWRSIKGAMARGCCRVSYRS